jgi:protein phosphatase
MWTYVQEMEPQSTPHPSSSRAAAPRPLHLDVAACTDPGLARRDNQDSFLVVEPDPAWAVLAVCDGMGGAAGGGVASRTAVNVLREVVTAGGPPSTRDSLGRRLLHGVEEASRQVFAAARASRSLKGMGTTATACALAGDALYIAQVGDSRAYLLRDGCLTQLTRDQTLATLMMEQGQLAPEDVATFPMAHVILQAVGTAERVEVDLTRVQVTGGDVILLCSDGLHGPLAHETLRAVLADEPSAAAACARLVALANEAGGPDNITCIVARIAGDPRPGPSIPPVPEKARLDDDSTIETKPIAETATGADLSKADAREMAVVHAIARLAGLIRRKRARS